MRARVLRAAIAMSLLVITAGPALGQSVLLRLSPESGLVSRYVTATETLVDSPMMPSDQPFMIGDIWSTQTVIGVEGDVIELEMVTDSAQIETPAMPMLQGQMPDMTGESVIMKMDTRGRLIETDLGGGPQAQQIASQMGSMGLQFPEDEVSPGDSWGANIDYELPGMGAGGAMAMSMQLTYTLLAIGADNGDSQIVTVQFEGPVVMSGSQGGIGMQASGTSSGAIMFDVKKGRMTANEMTMVIDMDASGMAMSMTQTVEMRLIN